VTFAVGEKRFAQKQRADSKGSALLVIDPESAVKYSAAMSSQADVSGLIDLFEQWKINNLSSLYKCARDDAFRKQFVQILRDTAKRNGATLTLSTAAVWISAAIGSIGIAGLGSAVGVPLALILIPLGLLSGGFLDEDGLLSRTRKRVFTLFGMRNVADRKEAEAELALITQALQIISDRVDSLSDFTNNLTVELKQLQEDSAALVRRQSRHEKMIVGLIIYLLVVTTMVLMK
jgi:hypothetical protein